MNIDMAKRLADRRKRAGFSQESLALELGVSRQAVSKWERSESSPDTDNLIALAQLYGVSLDDLLYKDVEDDPESAIDSEAAVSEGVACDLEGNNSVATCEGASAEAGHAHENDGNESNDPSADQPDGTVDNEGDHNYSRRESDDVHIGPDGIHIESNGKGDSVHISWKDGIHVKDGSHGDEVHVGWDGIRVNDHRYDDWRDAHAHWDGSKKKHPNPAWLQLECFPLSIARNSCIFRIRIDERYSWRVVFRDRIFPFDSCVLCSWRPALWEAGECFLQCTLFIDRDRGLHLASFGRVRASWMDRAREHPFRCGIVQRHRSLVAHSKEVMLEAA